MIQMISNKQSVKLAVALKTIMVGLIVLISTAASPLPSYALSVPLTVQEALPSGVSGMARTAAPVTVGLPLPEDSGITNVNQLGLSGVTAGQFRPLAWWPNGNIRWVLADFQTNLTAGQVKSTISLTDGSGSFGGVTLATDTGATISVNTGSAQFVIRKSSFNVFDSVVVGGQPLVTSGNMGRISAVGADDTVYSSENDGSSSAVVEENGPVRAVVKASGSLKSVGGTRLMDYTVRLHFYKGKSFVKGDLILRNASKNAPQAILFKSAEAVVPLTLAANKTVNFSRKSDVVSRTLSVGNTAYLFQGFNAARTIPDATNCFTWDPPVPGICAGNVYTYDLSYLGLSVQVGAESVNSFGNNQDWSQGYAGISDASGKGVNVAFRWLSSNFPGGFEFNDNGEVSTEIFSKHNAKDLKLQFGKHEMREVMWDFTTQTKDGKEALYALEYPPIARSPFSHYQSAKALFGQNELVTVAEQQSVFSAVSKTSPLLTNPAMSTVYRAWYWPGTGGGNQTDFPLNDLLDYLRTGNPGFFLTGEQRTIFNATTAVSHSDDFALENITQGTDPLAASRGLSGAFYDMEHANAGSIPFYYFLSGNEEIKDSFLDYGELMYRTQLSSQSWYQIPGTPYLRAWSRKQRNLALTYEFSCQTGSCATAYKSELETVLNTFLDLRDNPSLGYTSPHGRNLERGYLWWDTTATPYGQKRTVHSLFHTQIHFEGIWQLYRIMHDTGWNYGRVLDLEDYMSGLSHFFFDEYLDVFPANDPNHFKYGFAYDYLLDEINTSSLSPYSAERQAVWLYQQTGNPSYLDKSAHLLWEITQYATSRSPSELQEQAFMWTYLNKTSIPIWQNLPVTVNDNGGGSYTLSWTVPTGATKYQIKFSDKPIVEWLGFDKVSRTYQYDPAQYTAFFAAKNITNNPAPDTAGMTQSITLTGLPAGQKFAIKCLATPPVKPPAPVKGFMQVNW